MCDMNHLSIVTTNENRGKKKYITRYRLQTADPLQIDQATSVATIKLQYTHFSVRVLYLYSRYTIDHMASHPYGYTNQMLILILDMIFHFPNSHTHQRQSSMTHLVHHGKIQLKLRHNETIIVRMSRSPTNCSQSLLEKKKEKIKAISDDWEIRQIFLPPLLSASLAALLCIIHTSQTYNVVYSAYTQLPYIHFVYSFLFFYVICNIRACICMYAL